MPHFITGERIVGRHEVPWRGINRLARADALPADALRDASNVLPREGKLRFRPGYSQFNATVMDNIVTGIFPYMRGAADPVPILSTSFRHYKYDGGAIVDITGTPSSAQPTQLSRFATIALGTPAVNNLIISNGADPPMRWTGTGTLTNLLLHPKWTDITTIADHVIGIRPPYEVTWCAIRDIAVPPALNIKQASETVDPVVAIRPLGNGAGAVLCKERSLWPVTYIGGQSEARSFQFGPYPFGFWDGPASPAAWVDVDGAAIYMTPTGRIAIFNGSNHLWIGDGLWPTLRDDIDRSQSGRIWGMYDSVHGEVHFVYPSLTTASAMRGWVGISLPKAEQGVQPFGVFRGWLTHSFTAGATIRLTDKIDRLWITGGPSPSRLYTMTMDVDTDQGTGFAAYWQTGLLALPGFDPLRLDSVETLADRGDGYGQLDLRMVSSWVLGNDDGQLAESPSTVELGQNVEPAKGGSGVEFRGRWVGVRYDVADSSAVTLGWKGANIVGLKKVGG